MSNFSPEQLQLLVDQGRFSPQYAQQYANDFQLQVPKFAQNGLEPQTADSIPQQYASNEQAAPIQEQSPEPVLAEPTASKSKLSPIKTPKGLGGLNAQNTESSNDLLKATEAATTKADTIYNDQLKESQKIAEEHQVKYKEAEDAQREILKRQQNLDRQIQDYQIDPNRYLSGDRGLIATIANAVSTFGSALSGQHNQLGEQIQKEVERDVRAQEVGLEKLKLLHENGRISFDQYNTMLDRIPKDRESMIAFAQAKAATRLQQVANSLAPSEMKNKLIKQAQDLTLSVSEQNRKWAETNAVIDSHKNKTLGTLIDNQNAIDQSGYVKDADGNYKYSLQADFNRHGLPGSGFYSLSKDPSYRPDFKDPQNLKSFRTYTEGYLALKGATSELASKIKDAHVTKIADLEQNGDIRQAASSVANIIRDLYNLGVPSGRDQDIVNASLGGIQSSGSFFNFVRAFEENARASLVKDPEGAVRNLLKNNAIALRGRFMGKDLGWKTLDDDISAAEGKSPEGYKKAVR